MVRSPCCYDGDKLKKGPWTQEEDKKLVDCISKHGHGSWRLVPKLAGLNRCGKSCRLRWINYLRPDIKRGKFSDEEERLIIHLHSVLGNKWSKIAGHLPGRTDNEIKNFWNTHIRKKLVQMGIDPKTHKPTTDLNHLLILSQLLGGNLTLSTVPWNNIILKLHADATQLAKIQMLQNLLHFINTTTLPNISLLGPQNPNQLEEIPSGLTTLDTKELAASSTWAKPDELTDPIANPSSSLNMENYNSYTIQTENQQLPELVSSASASPETSIIFNPLECSGNYSAGFTDFQSLDKFMDDETTSSFWKDILDSTSILQSPASSF